MHAPQSFFLPRFEMTFAHLPANGSNPFYSAIRPKSQRWISRYSREICNSKMLAFMDECQFELSTAYTYPLAGPKQLRAAMDLVNILWLYDEYTDTKSGVNAVKAACLVRRALVHPESVGQGDPWICRMMVDFVREHLTHAGPNTAHRFVHHFCSYADRVGDEATLREQSRILSTIEEYTEFRRETSAIRTCFDLVEYCLGIDLPEFVHQDPVFRTGYNAAMDLVFWVNDLYSYNMEQAKGHEGANVVTVIVKSKRLDLQAAVNYVADYCKVLASQFFEARKILSCRPESVFSEDAVQVLDAFGDWVRGNEEWSMETPRYFGEEREMVKQTRIVRIKVPSQEVNCFSE